MKLRSKLLLSATCLLTISVAATATSAYAWFTANRQVYLKSTATVDTKVTNLNVKGFDAVPGDGDTVGFSTTAVSGDLGSGTSTATITDISGNGINFYKPELPADKSTDTAMSIKKVLNGDPAGTNYYHQFKLEFSQTNTNISTGVFLANDSSVTAVNTDGDNKAKDEALAKSIRVSITVGDSKTIYWAPNENSSSINTFYLAGATPAEVTNVSLTKASDYVKATDTGILNKIIGAPVEYNDASNLDKKSTATELLGKLDSNNKLTATIRVWAEGMDVDCDNDAFGGNINVKLVFNGVNMNI